MKYVIVLGDGMADYPIEKLGNKTPLQVANKPNIDALAKISEVGLCKTVPDSLKPGSDVANLSVLGYNPLSCYTGRSPLEAASIGIDMKRDDISLRANLVTLSGSGEYEDLYMKDYSAGEISTEEARVLINFLKDKLKTENTDLYSGVSYRHCFIMHGGKTGTELTPPHDISDKPIKGHLPSGINGDFLLSVMKKSFELLKNHPVNIKRIKEGKNPANSLWFWGEGTKPAIENFEKKFSHKGVMVSAVDLLKGIGKLSGMSVPDIKGATGNYTTDFTAKADAVLDAFDNGCDFAYIHMEAPDECGHQGDLEHKIYSIEQIDFKVVKYLKEKLESKGEDFAMLILPDHPTPIAVKTHVKDPVPYLLYNSKCVKKGTSCYDEFSAKSTGIFVGEGYKLIEKLFSCK